MTNGAAAQAAGTSPTNHWIHDLHPVALDLGFFQIRWYSLAYLAGIFIGYLYLRTLIRQPGAPMARRHADDLVFFSTLGIILGGRLGYVLFYKPMDYIREPLEILQLWDGGMSFHGGLIGTMLAMLYVARKNGLSFLRVSDYIACVVPFGLLFGRLANFVNGELWGRPTDVWWAVRFQEAPGVLGPPRHPSQLYEAALEGLLLLILLSVLFWFTRARYKPGLLAGLFAVGYGASRFAVEFFREPDAHLTGLAQSSGLSMGQWLTIPMILIGLYMMATSFRRDPLMAAGEGEATGAPEVDLPPEGEEAHGAV